MNSVPDAAKMPARAQSGEAKARPQPRVADHEATRQCVTLLKVLALGQQDMKAGRIKPLNEVVAWLRAQLAGR